MTKPIAIRKDCGPEQIAQEVLELQVSDAAGIYLPKHFIEQVSEKFLEQIKKQTSEGTVEILKDPDHEWYWEAWDEVLNVELTTSKGARYTLFQHGDLWAVNMTVLETFSDECQENFWEEWQG